jgi:hypothetical protein
MKLRNGFVSNSSSSSFVCIGFKVTNSINKIINKKVKDAGLDPEEDGKYEFLENNDIMEHCDGDYLGIDIDDSNNDFDSDISIVDIKKIEKHIEKLVSLFEIDKKNIKIISGAEYN